MSPRFLLPSSRLVLLLAALHSLSAYAAIQPNSTNAIPDPELKKLFNQIGSVSTPPIWNPSLGGQNFTTCCLKAINEALTVKNGVLAFTNDSYYSNWIVFDNGTTNLSALIDYNAQGQFPCTASYNGNPRGAPVVQVPYQWLNDTCPGWQISSKDNLNAWLQPLSGFLIPAVIFCISVPRRRKLILPSVLFSSDQGGVQGYLLAPVGATIALAMVTIDTLVWLCICFAFAGPMIISGLYEAMLDNRVIDYVRVKIDEKRLTLDMRCRCLMIILIGNLDLVWNTDRGGYVDGGHVDGGHVDSGRVDGGTHMRKYDSFGNVTDDANVQLLHQSSPSYGADGHPMTDLRGHYQGVPPRGCPNGCPSPVPAGSPSAPSVSPGSPAPAIPHSSVDGTYAIPPQGLPISPLATEQPSLGNTPPPMRDPVWNQPSGRPDSASGGPGPHGLSSPSRPLARTQSVGTPPPPPTARAADHAQAYNSGYGLDYGVGHGQSGPAIPRVSVSSASTGPQQLPHRHTMPQDVQSSPFTGFPPAPATPGSQNPSPSTAFLAPATPGTPIARSGLISSGLIAAGIAFGGKHHPDRQLLASHQNGGSLASPWQHMEKFLYGLRIYPDDDASRNHSPRQNAKCHGCDICMPNSWQGRRTHGKDATLIPRSRNTAHLIYQVKTRLKTMLHCQYSFGSVIGAPVVFFLGGFIFALLQSLDTLGDEDIAEGLAFGQWYLTIPHIAIVSGLLLAGNNPSILEGVLAVDDRTFPTDERRIWFLRYGLAYPSCYKVASLWDRGYNKKQWVDTLVKTYATDAAGHEDHDIQGFKKKTTLTLADWVFLLFLTMLLIGVPFILAFITAYFTPEVGLSCRSLTFTIFICVQAMQILLWMWAYAGPLPRSENPNPGWFGVNGRLDRHGFYKPYSLRWLFDGGAVPRSPSQVVKHVWKNPRRLLKFGFLWNMLYYPLQYFLGLVGIMAAIGGTAMQLIGVYSSDICYITTGSWFLPYSERPMAKLSTNSAMMIKTAEDMWMPCAISAIVFMSVVSFIGWWYQRRMRDLFTQQVLRIDDPKHERYDTTKSRNDGIALEKDDYGMRHPSSSSLPPPEHRSSSAASSHAAPAATRLYSSGMRAMSESAAATGYTSPPSYGGYSANFGPSYEPSYGPNGPGHGPSYGALRGYTSMPMIPTARMSVASMPAWVGPVHDVHSYPHPHAPGTAPLPSGVWTPSVASPTGLGYQGVVSPGMPYPHGPAAGSSSFPDPSASFSGPSGYNVPVSEAGLGVYAPVGNPDLEAGGPSRRPPRQTTFPNDALLEEDERGQ